MDKKALIHFWMMPPSNYFEVPVKDRLEQLRAVLVEKRVQTDLMYALLKAQPKKERP
jgi:hypothetical protein